jgi:hypothetical protein
MTARVARTAASAALVLALAGCTSYYEIPVETPIQPKLDVGAFSRVFVAGFIAGGTQDVDGNLETVRLLRSQLRTKSTSLRVIDADVLPLLDVAKDNGIEAPPPGPPPEAATGRNGTEQEKEAQAKDDKADEPPANGIRDEKDLEPFERVFANAEYWKRIGEEYQQPLIVTGTVLFTPHSRSGFVQREQEVFDSLGRRRVVPVRTYQERKGYILRPTFIFIDGRTGATLHTETFREEILYNQNQTTPALSSYFELMDRLLPSFLNTLSMQKVKGSRVLLK